MMRIARLCGLACRETALGPVDKPDPDTNASEQDKSEEAGCCLVISGGDAPLLLEMTNEALDARAQRIEPFADRVLHFAISLGRDLRRGAAVAQVVTDRNSCARWRTTGSGVTP